MQAQIPWSLTHAGWFRNVSHVHGPRLLMDFSSGYGSNPTPMVTEVSFQGLHSKDRRQAGMNIDCTESERKRGCNVTRIFQELERTR